MCIRDRYQWHKQGSQGYSDQNRFVLLDQGPTSAAVAMSSPQPLAAYSPMCLTVHGTRLSSSGPVTTETIVATMCGYRSFPVEGLTVAGGNIGLLMALARGGPGGMVD